MSDDNRISGFPRQKIPFGKKSKKWMQNCIDFAETFTFPESDVFGERREHIKSNRNLLRPNGEIDKSEYMALINPANIKAEYVPKSISHYNIMNSPLHVLEGEESSRPFNYEFVITNYNGISDSEEKKMNDATSKLMQLVQDESVSEEQYREEVAKLEQYYKYTYKDIREIWANVIIDQYSKEYNMPLMFNKGFWDSFSSAWEVYDVCHKGNEPYVQWVDPLGLSVLMSKNSSNIEDAMIVSYTTYMHVSEIIDRYSGDEGNLKGLTEKDIDKLENIISGNGSNEYNPSSPYNNYYRPVIDTILNIRPNEKGEAVFKLSERGNGAVAFDANYDDFAETIGGYVKVTEVRWKSMRRIRRVKRYNYETGEPEYHIFNDSYVLDKDMGEECEEYWISDPYQGIKIGDGIYVRCGERQCKYRKMDSPSECHLGYVGSIYSFDNKTPYCLVDMMRKHAILYDVVMDKLLRFIARDNGKAVRIDLAKMPPKKEGWNINALLYFFYSQGILFENSFSEGDKGMATGKLAGSLNNNTNPSIDADMSNVIMQYINILSYIKSTLNEIIGISPQRMGQVSNRETVGGVERATLQSSHITEWVFMIHEDIKRRVCDAFIEEAKWCYANKSKKLKNILPGYVTKVFDIDGEYFRTADYGMVVDNTNNAMVLDQKIDALAQAALQNQLVGFTEVLQLYASASNAEKMAIVRAGEQEMRQRQQQAQQQQQEQFQQQLESKQQIEQQKIQADMEKVRMDNETKLLIANISNQYRQYDVERDGIAANQRSEELLEKMRQFDEQMRQRDEDRKSNEKIAKEKIDAEVKMNKEDNKTKVDISKRKPTSK